MQKTILVDAMLKNLARWLRVFGARVVFAGDLAGENGSALEDDELLRFALKKGMAFITRDEELGRKAQGYVPTILLRTTDVDEQLLQVMARFSMRIPRVPSHALCAHCGGKLKRVPKGTVKERVFPKVFSHNRVFWQCQNPNCRQLYWKGSHWEKILKKAEKLSLRLSATLQARRAAGAQGLKLGDPA